MTPSAGLASHKRAYTVQFHSCEVPRVVRFMEIGSRVVAARGWVVWGQKWRVSIKWERSAVLSDEKCLEMDSSDSCTIM